MKHVKYADRTQVERPSILVLTEKHGTCYFYVENDEALFRAALEIVQTRKKREYYYEPEPPQQVITKEEVEKLPDAVKAEGQKKLSSYLRDRKRFDHENELWGLMECAIREQDGKAAWKFLRSRAEWEYEGISIERAYRPGEYSKS